MTNANTAAPSVATATRELYAIWTASASAWLEAVFETQNATIGATRTAFERLAELTRRAQETTLKTYQAATTPRPSEPATD